MDDIHITLTNTNYTEQAATDINLNLKERELLENLLQKIEDGLYSENAAYLSIQGISNEQIKLTVTGYEKND